MRSDSARLWCSSHTGTLGEYTAGAHGEDIDEVIDHVPTLRSVAAQASVLPDMGAMMGLVGKWFTFWGVGARLFLAGLNQVFRPSFTAEEIFEIGDPAVLPIVREIGFANLAIGTFGLPVRAGLSAVRFDCRRPVLWSRRNRPRVAQGPHRERAGCARLRLAHVRLAPRFRRQPRNVTSRHPGVPG